MSREFEEDRTALITGPPSGIGLELARLFARDDADVILVARSEGWLESVADDLETRHGVSAECCPTSTS
jgi:short-subunit dehydrogenase